MSEIGPTQIIYGVLALIIIVSFLFVGIYSFSTTARNFVDKIIDYMGEDEPIVETPESIQVEQQFFNQFFEDYQKCKKSPDAGCICNIRSVYIPEGHYLEIQNRNDVTSMSLTPGIINIRGEPSRSDRAGPQFKNIEGKDKTLIGYFSPSVQLIGQPYTNEQGEFLFERYFPMSNLLLVYDTDIPREVFNPDFYSQVKVYHDRVASVSINSFNLKGIYKVDSTQMAFVPSPVSSGGDARMVPSDDENRLLAQQFRSLPKCRDTIEGYEQAKDAFDNVTVGISQSILFRYEPQNGPLFKMTDEQLNLPNNFKIKIYPTYIALFEGDKVLARKEMKIGIDIASGRRGTSSWRVTTQGVCYYGLNVIPSEFSQKSYSYEEGYELRQPFTLDGGIKKISIYKNSLHELCFVPYDTENLASTTAQ